MSSSPWWKPLPLIFSCFGCLFSVLLNVWRWILNKKCCKNNNNNNNYYYCCCYEGNKSLINKIEEGNEEEKQLKIFANQPLLHLCSPLKLIEENPPLPSIENGRIHSSKEDLKIISQKELEETKSLDRNLFSIKWNKRLNNSSTKLNCNNKNIRPTLEKRKENINGDYDSPSIALLDPCTSTSSSPAIQNSNSSHSSVPQRLACFLSKRLKRTKSFPKIQSALSRDKLSSGVGSEQLLLIKTSLGSNALRTDQQQQQQRNHQPLSLYLPVGPTEEKLKSSRSYESLLLLNQTANNNLQKSPSESENKMLLQPFPFDNKQQLKQPQQFPNNLSSPLETNIENNEGYINGYWSNNNSIQKMSSLIQQQQNNNNYPYKYQQRYNKRNEQFQQHQQQNLISRIENSLSIWILEAKGISPKKKFFCEISLDNIIKARTSTKSMSDGICFWGEHFNFQKLSCHSQQLCIDLIKEPEPYGGNGGKKKKSLNNGKSSHEELHSLIGLVKIPLIQLIGKQPIEKWYLISSGELTNQQQQNCLDSSQPSLRLKARYQSIQVLPLIAYLPFRKSLFTHFLPLCTSFEPLLGVKAKEDFANSLVRILHIERNAPEALVELIMAEVLIQENDHLLFRGNSLATKAVEAYMKLVATDYLQMALGDFIKQLLSSDLSCEVDPLRLCNGNNNSSSGSSSSNSSGSGSSISSQLEKSRQQLTKQVETAWRRILACQHLFPYPLKLLFSGLRHRLEQAGRTELTDNCMHRKILSSSIFLRFLCPAILSPSLFGLVSEYPTGKAARNLTLIAKSLQTLANFTRFGGKEAYMEFMNIFVEREWRNMQHFLRQISAPCARYCQACEAQDSTIDCTIDLGKELSLLASYMREHCDQLLKEKQQIKENGLKNIDCIAIKQLWNALMIINNWGNKEENFKNKLKEENEKMAPLVTMEGFGGDHSPGNPPSDYENNITTTTKIVPPPIPLARRAIIPQPIDIIKENKFKGNLYGGESCQPISAPPVTNSPFSDQKPRFSFSPSNISPFVSTAAVHHLNTTDDYVLSSALNKLRTTKNLNNNKQYNISSSIHLYDETPRREQQQQTFSHLNHLYDEVATEHLPLTSLSTSASRALNSGVVIAHRGVASHETTKHRGELCTVIQRNTFRTVDDEADDESESGEEERVEEIEEENEELQRRTSQRRHHLPNDVYSHKHCSSGEQNYLVANFDSSSASATSNNLKNQMVIMPPSSGYQSQLNSSSYSNSSSPTNTAESSPPPLPITTNKLIIQSPKIVLKNLPKNSFSSQLLNQSNNKNINSCQSSSSSASSAYSSLSPTNQQNNNKLRKSAENAAMHLLDELKSEQTKHDLKQQNQLPKPRTNPSCWSVPGFSGQIQPRSAFIGSNPTDPLTAFVRYPLLNSTTTSKQQQISPKEIEEKKLFQKFPTCSELFFNENNTNISRFNNQNILSSQNQQTNLLAAEMELIEAQRYQIAELTRENAALRHELKTVRAVSSQHIANREEKIKASTESM